MERHGALAGVQDEQLRPDEPEQGHLVGHLEFREEGYVLGPLNRREEQSGGQLADVVDAHDVVGLHALAISRGGIRFRPQEQRDVGTEVRVPVEAGDAHGIPVGDLVLAMHAGQTGLCRWNAATLDS